MKLLRYGPDGLERPGLLDSQGVLRDASAWVDDWAGDALDPDLLNTLADRDAAALPAVPGSPRIGPCVGGTRHFLAIGLNYRDHAAESGMAVPAEPILFSKAPSSIAGPNDDVPLPPGSERSDWEVELAFVIGRAAYRVSEAEAPTHIAGYCVCNDLSERRWQLEGTGQWSKGKSAPGYGPVGPWLVTPDEVGNPLDLAMFLEVNGVRRQDGSTRTMIFGPHFLVSYLSHFMRLEPGDIVTTGTPPGVGMASNTYLHAGDVIRLGIDRLGEQRQRVIG